MVLPWAETAVGLEVDGLEVEGLEVEGEPGFMALPLIGVEGLPPQLTRVRAIKTNTQIFTRNSPA
jgi:hypothetical protein